MTVKRGFSADEVAVAVRTDVEKLGGKFTPNAVQGVREERDVIETYELGVNAYVVKPVEFSSFTDAVKQLGLFWAVINEPPIVKSPIDQRAGRPS